MPGHFFAWVIESGFATKADPARGSFRAFLKTALGHFVVDRNGRKQTQARGGGRLHVALDQGDGGTYELPVTTSAPDDALDAEWRKEMIKRAFEVLGAELRAAGQDRTFVVFRDYYLATGVELDYRTLAERHGITTATVSNLLQDAKRHFRDIVRRAVLETVSSPEDLEEELRWLTEGPQS